MKRARHDSYRVKVPDDPAITRHDGPAAVRLCALNPYIHHLRQAGVPITRRSGGYLLAGACLGEYGAPACGPDGCESEMDVGGRVQADAGMAVLVVVPVAELVHERPCGRE
ncbi:hypothetical protein GCM10027184_06470 [Saccharothrix stipae]